MLTRMSSSTHRNTYRKCLVAAAIGAACIGVAIALYALAGFYGLPYLVKTRAPAMIEQMTGRKATVEAVEFDPFALRAAIQGFSLLETGGEPFVRFERLAVALDVRRSLQDTVLTIKDVALSKPFVRLARDKNGQFNFNDLLTSTDKTPADEGKAFPVRIDHLALTGGNLLWQDGHFAKPVKEEIAPIDLTVEHFTLAPGQAFTVHLKLALKSGGVLDWQGEAGIDPVFSKGRVKLEQLTLQQVAATLLQEAADFTMQGTETFEAEYNLSFSSAKGLEMAIPKSRFELKNFVYGAGAAQGFALKAAALSLESDYKITANGPQWRVASAKAAAKAQDLTLSGFGLADASAQVGQAALSAAFDAGNADGPFNVRVRDGQASIGAGRLANASPLIEIDKLTAENISLDLVKRSLSASAIKSEHADFKAWLDKDGKLNYSSMLPARAASSTTAPQPEKKNTPWTIKLDTLALNDFGLHFEDRSQGKPVAVEVKPVDFALRNFSSNNARQLPVRLSAGFNGDGRIKLDGDLDLDPFAARLNVSLSDIGLDRFQTYVDCVARLDVIDGGLFADGKLVVALKEPAKPDIRFKGLAGIADLVTRDQLQNKDFIKWRKLTLSDIDADLQALRYTAKRLLIEKPYARVVIKKDKTVNVQEVLSTGKPAAKTPPAAASKPRAADGARAFFKLDQVLIQDGSSDFADLSLILPFAAEIKELNGGASGISSDKKSRIKVALKGNAYDLAPVDVGGEVSPYQGAFDVGISFHGLPMPLVSPYMVQFAGYKVEKGKLNLDLKYKVEQGVLTAANNILIDQFELGEKVENPNAVSLPLEMAVALLKDGDNRIKLDVPITGSLDDPKFNVRAIVVDALMNVLKKVVASPFTAIASLFESGGENLDHIHFKPGKADLDKAQTDKLDGLAKALKDRPALSMEVKGAAFEEQDWPALKDAALYDQLKTMKAAAVTKKSGKKLRAEYVELSDDDYKTYLAQMFIDKFPLLAERSLFGTPRLIGGGKDDFYAVARQKLFTIIKPEQERLKELAAKRAQAIAKYIVQQGGIDHARVFILDSAINPEREGQDVVSRLTLKVD